MTGKVILGILLFSSGVLLEGCAPVMLFGAGMELGASVAEERGLGGVISDVALKNTLRYRLMNHDMGLFSHISILVHQGRALLTGQVDNQQHHKDVLKVVKGVEGIKEVIDEIKVKPASGVTQMTRDALISTQLNSALMLDENIDSINYQIKTEEGVVYILGVAQDRKELEAVTNHARSLGGVKQVVSHVKIKKTPSGSQGGAVSSRGDLKAEALEGGKDELLASSEEEASAIAPDLPDILEPVHVQTAAANPSSGPRPQHVSDPIIQDASMDESLPPPEAF